MTTPSAERWLRAILAEAARAQDDPRRDAAFQAWKAGFSTGRRAKRGGGRGKRGKLDLLFPRKRDAGNECEKRRQAEGGPDGEAVG